DRDRHPQSRHRRGIGTPGVASRRGATDARARFGSELKGPLVFGRPACRLQRDSSSRFLPWIIALMVFMGALALAAAMMVDAAVDRWDRGLRGSLSVQIPPGPSEAAGEEAV